MWGREMDEGGIGKEEGEGRATGEGLKRGGKEKEGCILKQLKKGMTDVYAELAL